MAAKCLGPIRTARIRKISKKSSKSLTVSFLFISQIKMFGLISPAKGAYHFSQMVRQNHKRMVDGAITVNIVVIIKRNRNTHCPLCATTLQN